MMKIISVKSILSPGRARESSQFSLSSSLSRRLKSNGSIKVGQASPMFSNGGKKRGSGVENVEPSSPKVTCIGQVRVKTMNKGKKMRSRSRSRSRSGSTRRGEVSFRKLDQNGVEVLQNQKFQCRNQRWVHLPLTICEALRSFRAEFNCFLPCRSSCLSREKGVQAVGVRGGGGAGGDSGAVVARWLVAVEGEERGEIGSHRRHVFEEIEIKEEDEARVSICVPPKNALLLMRCRSDPVKMAALANRFWEVEDQDLKVEQIDEEEEEEDEKIEEIEGINGVIELEADETNGVPEPEPEATMAVKSQEESDSNHEENAEMLVEEKPDSMSVQSESKSADEEEEESMAEKAIVPENRSETENQETRKEESMEVSALPDCLLLMMCEPKLSMEVSKETWICRTDFIKCLPERRAVKKTDSTDAAKKIVSSAAESNPSRRPPKPVAPVIQPGRSSCSYPAPPAVEQKVGNSKAYQPFVLTRCKSEPMRSEAMVPPESCFWKNSKVGAAGVGF